MTVKAIRIKTTDIKGKLNEREVKILIILLSVFTGAMIIGAGYVNVLSDFNTIMNFYFDNRLNKNFSELFFNNIIINMLLLIIIFISGLNCIGTTFVVSPIIIKGFGLGLISGYLFSISAKGIGFYLINILPSNIISSASFVLGGAYATILSKDLFSCINNKHKFDEKTIKTYIIKFIILTLIIFISSLIDTVFCKMYYYLFFS